MKSLFTFFILGVFIVSCGDRNVDSTTFDHLEPWSYSDVLRGILKKDSAATPVTAKILVNYDDDFPYENLYIKCILTEGPDTIVNLVQSIPLQNDIGQWMGKKKGGDYEVSHTLSDSIRSDKSEIDFEIIQYSRDNKLSGINSIKVVLVKS